MMMFIKSGFIGFGFLLATGLSSAAQTSSYPKDFFEYRFASWAAYAIAEKCSTYGFSKHRFENDWKELVTKTRESGSVGRLKHNLDRLPEELFDPAFKAFFTKHKIYRDSGPEAYCAAGDAEKAARSRIGRYLK